MTTKALKTLAIGMLMLLLIGAATMVDWNTQIKNKPFLSPASFGGSIQAAHDALPAGGGEIHLDCAKTYAVTGLTFTKNVLLSGCGDSSIIQLASGTNPAGQTILVNTASTAVHFRNLVIDGNRANNNTQATAGVYCNGATTRCTFDNVWIENWNANAALMFQDSLYGKVVNCHFVNNVVHGVAAQQTSFGVMTQHVFANNDFEFSSYTVTNATNTSPIVVTTSTPHGFLTGASAQNVSLSGVGGNTAANNEFNITVLTATTFQLVGSTGNGAYTSGGKVYEGNFAIRLYQQNGVTVTGNTILSGGEGIQLDGTQNSTVAGNILNFPRDAGITVTGDSSTGSSSNNTISGNSVANAYFEGIYCAPSQSTGGGCVSNTFSGNSVTGSGKSGIAGRRSGYQFSDTSPGGRTNQNSITGGISTGNPEYGINVRSFAGNTAIANVFFGGNTTGKITVDGTDQATTYVDILGPRLYQWGCSGTLSSSVNLYLTVTPPGACTNTTESNATFFLNNKQTLLRGLQVRIGALVVNNTVITVRLNTLATAITCTITAGTNTCHDVTHSVVSNSNDVIDLQIVTGAAETATNVQASLDG